MSAVESDTFNQAAADLKTEDINSQLKQAALQQGIENAEAQKKIDIAQNLFDLGADFFLPKKAALAKDSTDNLFNWDGKTKDFQI